MSDYISLNKANWDERAPLHAASRDYATQAFVESADHLSQVVRFDLPLLGNIRGLRGCTCSATSAPIPCRWPVWAPR